MWESLEPDGRLGHFGRSGPLPALRHQSEALEAAHREDALRAEAEVLLREFEDERIAVDLETVPRLVGEIRRAAHPQSVERPMPPLSDATLALVTGALLAAVRRGGRACSTALRLGVVGHIHAIFLREAAPEGLPSCGLACPELQLALALILAEVIVQSANASVKRQRERKVLAPFLATATDRDTLSESFRSGSLGKATNLTPDALWAMETLLASLHSAYKWTESVVIWALLAALRRLVEHEICRQQLLLHGLLPLLHEMHDFLLRTPDNQLVVPRTRPATPSVQRSKDPPPFRGASGMPALLRATQTVKGKWLSTSFSLPDLGGPSPHQSVHPGRASFLAAHPRPELTLQAPTRPTLPSAALLRVLVDGVGSEMFQRVHDRIHLLAEVKAVLRRLETSRALMAAPFAARRVR